MNTNRLVKGFALAGALLFATSAFAGGENKGSVKILDKGITVDGKPLAPGKYDVELTGAGNDVKVVLRQGKNVVATVPAHVASAEVAPRGNGYSTRTQQDGTKALDQIFFAGKKDAINLDGQGSQAASGN